MISGGKSGYRDTGKEVHHTGISGCRVAASSAHPLRAHRTFAEGRAERKFGCPTRGPWSPCVRRVSFVGNSWSGPPCFGPSGPSRPSFAGSSQGCGATLLGHVSAGGTPLPRVVSVTGVSALPDIPISRENAQIPISRSRSSCPTGARGDTRPHPD